MTLVASALVMESLGLNLSSQSIVCPATIHSSFAFSMYFIIHSHHSITISVKLVIVVLSVDILLIENSIARASALVIGSFGLNIVFVVVLAGVLIFIDSKALSF